MKPILITVSLSIILLACTPISKEAKDSPNKPVDCTMAQPHIKMLMKEKASTAERLSAGIRSVLPTSAVLGILTGTTKDRASIATGKYNEMIEAKIAEIERVCGIKS